MKEPTKPPSKVTDAQNNQMPSITIMASKMTDILETVKRLSRESKGKIGWKLSGLVTSMYIIRFAACAHGDATCSGLMNGFCVYGNNPYPHMNERHHGVCDSSHNSHQYAFCIDAVQACVACALAAHNMIARKSSKMNETTFHYLLTAVIIALHGSLHYWISHKRKCDLCGNAADLYDQCTYEKPEPIKLYLYSAFCGLLVYANFRLAFPSWSSKRLWIVVMAVASGIISIGVRMGGDWSLTYLFATTMGMASMTGIFSASLSPQVGWYFLVSAIVGYIELVACESFFKRIGGHMWYDLSLHIAMLVQVRHASLCSNEMECSLETSGLRSSDSAPESLDSSSSHTSASNDWDNISLSTLKEDRRNPRTFSQPTTTTK